jgi:hypothetical protein
MSRRSTRSYFRECRRCRQGGRDAVEEAVSLTVSRSAGDLDNGAVPLSRWLKRPLADVREMARVMPG